MDMTHDFKLTQWDLVTYPGIAAAVIALVFGIKKMLPALSDGKEPALALILTYAIGIASKITIKGAFMNVNWLVFLVTLFMVAIFATSSYDHVRDVASGFGKSKGNVQPPPGGNDQAGAGPGV